MGSECEDKAKANQRRSDFNTDEADSMTSTPMAIALMALLIGTWWVVHWVARVIVTEYGITGGLIALGAIFALSFVMDR